MQNKNHWRVHIWTFFYNIYQLPPQQFSFLSISSAFKHLNFVKTLRLLQPCHVLFLTRRGPQKRGKNKKFRTEKIPFRMQHSKETKSRQLPLSSYWALLIQPNIMALWLLRKGQSPDQRSHAQTCIPSSGPRGRENIKQAMVAKKLVTWMLIRKSRSTNIILWISVFLI